jgi:hypothetical protein
MTLPSSGQISLNQVNVELGNSGTAQIGMNDSAVRTLFNDSSGQIAMSQGHGKSNFSPHGTVQGYGRLGASGTISAQAGDVVVAICGALTSGNNTLIPGFTSIVAATSATNWYNTPGYTTNCRIQYKILTGSETSFTQPTSSGDGCWVQYRFNTAVSNVNVTQVSSNQGGTINVTHNAETVAPLAMIRMVGGGGYSNNGQTRTMSNLMSGLSSFDASPANTGGQSYANFLTAVNYNQTTMSATSHGFNNPGVAASLKCT